MMNDTPEHLTIAETVDRFRIGRTRLYELIGSGEIDAIKLGRRTLVKTASLREFFSKLPSVAGGRQ